MIRSITASRRYSRSNAHSWSPSPGDRLVGERVEQPIHPRYPAVPPELLAAFTRPLRLTPLGADRQTPAGASFEIVGHELNESALSFFHAEPLPYRWVSIAFDSAAGETRYLVALDRCRFVGPNRYESGGLIVRAQSTARAA